MGLEDAGFSCLPLNEDTTFPVMTRYGQGSNVDALYLDPGPWITQNMDQVQPPPKDTHFSSAAQSALSSCSRTPTLPTSRVKGPLPSIRQRTAQACDKCRERKTKCSGHRPVCLRCTNRGLACEYSARQTRLRLPIRSRVHPGYIRPITENFLFNYQPAAATRSRLDPFVGIYEPTPVQPADWNGYQLEPTAYDTILDVL